MAACWKSGGKKSLRNRSSICFVNEFPKTKRRNYPQYTLLAIKLCDSSFLGKNLDLIHSHFKTDRVMSFIIWQGIKWYVGHHCWNFGKIQLIISWFL